MANPDARTALVGRDERYAEAGLETTVLPVYNDMLDPVSQPQTPLNLPESRHRSRLDVGTIASSGQTLSGAHREAASLRARRPRREGSPIGLRTPGFIGFFGGMENADEFAML